MIVPVLMLMLLYPLQVAGAVTGPLSRDEPAANHPSGTAAFQTKVYGHLLTIVLRNLIWFYIYLLEPEPAPEGGGEASATRNLPSTGIAQFYFVHF